MKTTSILQMSIRTIGLIELVLGFAFGRETLNLSS